MAKTLGSTSIEEFDFESAIQLASKPDGFTFKIGEVGLLDTKYGTYAVIVNKDNGEKLYTTAEVVVNSVRSSINKGIKLTNRIVVLVENKSTNFDEDTGEFYTYLTLEEASGSQKFEWNKQRQADNVAKRAEFEANNKEQ